MFAWVNVDLLLFDTHISLADRTARHLTQI